MEWIGFLPIALGCAVFIRAKISKTRSFCFYEYKEISILNMDRFLSLQIYFAGVFLVLATLIGIAVLLGSLQGFFVFLVPI